MTPQRPERVPRPVLALGAVSLQNDTSSEMAHALLPLFLRQLGAPPAFAMDNLGAAIGPALATLILRSVPLLPISRRPRSTGRRMNCSTSWSASLCCLPACCLAGCGRRIACRWRS